MSLQASPGPKLRAFPSLGRNSASPGEERGIWQGARPAAWHPELAASSPGWGRGVSRGTHCRENCWRGSRRAREVQGHAETPEETLGSLQLTAPHRLYCSGGGKGTPPFWSRARGVRGWHYGKESPQSSGHGGLGVGLLGGPAPLTRTWEALTARPPGHVLLPPGSLLPTPRIPVPSLHVAPPSSE